MKKLIVIWLFICGASFVCIDSVLKVQKIYSTIISIETTAENNEKDDIGDAIIHYFPLTILASSTKSTNQYTFQLVDYSLIPEPRPPRMA